MAVGVVAVVGVVAPAVVAPPAPGTAPGMVLLLLPPAAPTPPPLLLAALVSMDEAVIMDAVDPVDILTVEFERSKRPATRNH